MDTMLKDDILRTILSMTPIDRIEIIDKVFEDFDSDSTNDIEILWAEESERRIDAFTNGSVPVDSAEDVFKKINTMK